MSGTHEDAVKSALRTVSCAATALHALETGLQGPLGTAFSAAVEAMATSTGRVMVTGVGKSGHIARKIAATLASTGRPAHFLHAADASHGDLGTLRSDDVVLALSWSGETAELADVVAYARRFRLKLIACTGNPDSTLAQAADIALLLPACTEACTHLLAPTTSTTLQLALGDALAVALSDRGSFTAEDFHALHPGGRLGARLLRVRALMHTGDEIPLLPHTASLTDAIIRITSGRFGIAGVLDAENRLVGSISDGDLRRAFARGLHDRPATEVMGREPRTTHPDELAHAALARMNAEGITSLFVVQEDAVVGVLHVHDLLRAGLV